MLAMCNDVEHIDGLVINAFVERVFSPGFLVKNTAYEV